MGVRHACYPNLVTHIFCLWPLRCEGRLSDENPLPTGVAEGAGNSPAARKTLQSIGSETLESAAFAAAPLPATDLASSPHSVATEAVSASLGFSEPRAGRSPRKAWRHSTQMDQAFLHQGQQDLNEHLQVSQSTEVVPSPPSPPTKLTVSPPWAASIATDRFVWYRKFFLGHASEVAEGSVAEASADMNVMATVALAAWAAVLVWLLKTTTYDFFIPALVYWCNYLHMRPEFAGATLVALGNAAPETLSMFKAASQGDVPLGLCELLGTNMCVLCVAGSGVLLARYQVLADGQGSYHLQVAAFDGRAFWPTVGCYALSLLCLVVPYLSDKVMPPHAAVLPVLYVLYLLGLTANGRYFVQSKNLVPREKRVGGDDFRAELSVGWNPYVGPPTLPGLAWPSCGTFVYRVAATLAWPTYVLRWALIPPADRYWDRTRRVFSAFAPIGLTTVWILLGYAGLSSDLYGGIVTPLRACAFGFALSATVLIFIGSGDGPHVPWFYPGLAFVAVVSSMFSLSQISGELTAVVEALALASGVPTLWLGSTAIAWGNSLGDFFMGIAMVQQGQEVLALTSIFTGPLFSGLVGTAASCYSAGSEYGGVLQLWGRSLRGRRVLLANIGFLGVAWSLLVGTLALRPAKHRLWPLRFVGVLLLLLYAVFVITIVSIEGVPRPILSALRNSLHSRYSDEALRPGSE